MNQNGELFIVFFWFVTDAVSFHGYTDWLGKFVGRF